MAQITLKGNPVHTIVVHTTGVEMTDGKMEGG